MDNARDEAADRYLDLLKRMLLRYDFEGRHATVKLPYNSYAAYLWELLAEELGGRDVALVEAAPFDAERRRLGKDWPAEAGR